MKMIRCAYCNGMQNRFKKIRVMLKGKKAQPPDWRLRGMKAEE
ncbi:hypothetical protein [Paraburkholderia sp. J12]|nr:hypothetical protein [Paraburkholderia sp. J12]